MRASIIGWNDESRASPNRVPSPGKEAFEGKVNVRLSLTLSHDPLVVRFLWASQS